MTKGKEIIIHVPEEVELILKALRGAGYEASIVGGCVRDSLLGRMPKDWDITTSALPEQVKSLFHNTADTGIEHGTVMVIIKGTGYEVTTYRVDGKYSDSRHPDSVQFTPSLEEDLKRRDFTINAFAYNPDDGLIDMFNGLEDLEKGCVRAVGNPRCRFDEDALRIMRAVRFAAQLSFDIEPETRAAVSEFAPKLANISRERIRVEFEKTLFSANPGFVNMYSELGLAQYIITEVSGQCFDPDSEPVYAGINAEDFSEKSKEKEYLLLSAFFKNLSSGQCRSVMRTMTFDNRSRDIVSGILKNKDVFLPAERITVKNALNTIGRELFELTLLYKKASGEDITAVYGLYQDIIASGEPYDVSMLAVNGRDLIEAGVIPGPAVGETLKRLTEEVIASPDLNTREELLKHI